MTAAFNIAITAEAEVTHAEDSTDTNTTQED